MAKRMTRREIEERRKIKKELQEKGIIPPDKPRLNRKKFAQEVCSEWENFNLSDYKKLYVFITVMAMMTNSGMYGAISKEDLGILKLKKCAMVLYEEMEKNKKMSYGEMIDLLSPIWKL
ncbi:hypothetical protein [Amedibacterium intestinale]|uniref:Addiction module toxin RelE n=1 Tax=Amedibacterium intestinale TaxID=2583452 RepID=A0A6N4TIB4_9FIRM|nr:hypothetical protein [Amedibacterium intestinale]BBK22750.1 hypothetical protein Aargi30884_16530 [Amedibacterium intestinale]